MIGLRIWINLNVSFIFFAERYDTKILNYELWRHIAEDFPILLKWVLEAPTQSKYRLRNYSDGNFDAAVNFSNTGTDFY